MSIVQLRAFNCTAVLVALLLIPGATWILACSSHSSVLGFVHLTLQPDVLR